MTVLDDLQPLPALGVGASLSFGVEPDPVELAKQKGGPSFIEYAGAVDHQYLAQPIRALRAKHIPLLYHPSCLNLCGPYPNPPEWLNAVDEHVRAIESPWLAQDVAVCFVGDTPGYSNQLGYFVPPLLTAAALDEATERVREVKAVVSAPLLLEPAPVTFLAGEQTIYEWLTELAHRTDCGLLLDAGHIVAHQLALGRGNINEGLDALDFGRVIELHVAGGVIREDGDDYRCYLDAHDLPILPETWQVAYTILEKAENLKAVCVECEGTLSLAVTEILRQTRKRVAAASGNPALVEQAKKELDG